MRNELFQQKFRIDSARLAGYDYGANGIYFVTICTQDRMHFFGDIQTDTQTQGATLIPTLIGLHTLTCWQSITERFPFVELDAFQLMPNHLHGILWICKTDYHAWQPNRFGPQYNNLPAIIRGFKAGVTAYARQNNLEFGWQARYYDRIVRNHDELNRIRTYIANNPAQWQQDRDNPENLYM